MNNLNLINNTFINNIPTYYAKSVIEINKC